MTQEGVVFGMVHPSTFEHLKTQFVFVSSSNVSNLGILMMVEWENCLYL